MLNSERELPAGDQAAFMSCVSQCREHFSRLLLRSSASFAAGLPCCPHCRGKRWAGEAARLCERVGKYQGTSSKGKEMEVVIVLVRVITEMGLQKDMAMLRIF